MIYSRVFAAVVLAAAIRYAIAMAGTVESLHAEIHGIASYLEVLGGLYSIVLAFLIYVVWEQFNRVQSGVMREASAIEDLCRIAAFLSDRAVSGRIRAAASRYLENTAGDEPRHLACGQMSSLAEDHYDALCQAVRGTDITTEKDEAVYSELLRALGRASDARDERLSVSKTRIPQTLWSLVLFVSCAVFAGFLVLGLRIPLLAAAAAGGAAGTITFLLSVVRDMDNPFVGEWNVSYAPFRAIAARVAQMGR